MKREKFRLRMNKDGATIRSGGVTTKLDPAEVREHLKDKVITSYRRKDPRGKESTLLNDLLVRYQDCWEKKISPHGERVVVTLLPGSHFKKRLFRDGYHLRVRFEMYTESGKCIYETARIQMVMERDIGIDWVEVTRCLLQCSESGYSTTDEDEEALRNAFGLDSASER